jgi:excisionase family DNA binding protein
MNTTLAFTVAEACEQAGTGRTTLYEAIRTGNLRAVKNGRRTIILAHDLQRWLESLPPITKVMSPLNMTPQARHEKGTGWQDCSQNSRRSRGR